MAWISKREKIPRGGRRWQLCWRDAAGKRSFEYYETKKEAEVRKAELGFRKSRGERVVKTKMTFGEFVDLKAEKGWFKRVAKRKKPATQRAWESYLRKHLLPRFEHRELQTFARAEVNDFAIDKRDVGLSRQTVASVVGLLQIIFQDAVEQNILINNPAARIKIPKTAEDHEASEEKGRNEDILQTEEQIVRLLLMANKMFPSPKPWAALYSLAVYSGLREGELLGLQWRDLDLNAEKPRLRVQRTWDRKNEFLKPKSKAALRSVPIFPEVKKILLEWLMLSRRKDAKARVFPITSGSALRPLRAVIRRLREDDPGFPRPSLHALRGTFASVMATRGVPPKVLQKWMGHSKISMTMDCYAKVMSDGEERVIEERLVGFAGL